MGDDEFSALPGFAEAPAHFESASQIARFQTEPWVQQHLFCPACGKAALQRFPNNQPVADLFCGECEEQFELKSQASKFGAKVVDGAFRTMIDRITSGRNPNLMLMRYDRLSGPVDVLVIPKHFFVPAIIERRKPLAPTARRAGWIGCNILIGRIPESGRIALVRDRRRIEPPEVVEIWRRTLFLRDSTTQGRGWLVEVMRAVEELGRVEFTLEDVYAAEAKLQSLFPENRNVRPKIRQQLQLLRDKGYLRFIGRGVYRRTS